jgi:hypothetical protein
MRGAPATYGSGVGDPRRVDRVQGLRRASAAALRAGAAYRDSRDAVEPALRVVLDVMALAAVLGRGRLRWAPDAAGALTGRAGMAAPTIARGRCEGLPGPDPAGTRR